MSPNSKTRIIFLDMMRALAVLMMIQGHTIDTFLGDQFRTFDSPIYDVWFTLRGFTAPIFMFTSGVTFAYLLRSRPESFAENPRVKKGVHRFIILVLIGYLLRFPTPRMFDFSEVTHFQWITFFTVDALHLIGFGILFILCLAYLAEKYKLSDNLVFSFGAFIFFSIFFVAEKINWANFIPIPFAAYFYQGTGSFFPLFPWAGYVISGAMLGSFLAKNPQAASSKKLSYNLFGIGAMLILFSASLQVFEDFLYGQKEFWCDNSALIIYRLGVVLMLNSIMSFIALQLKNIPDIVAQLGKNTLLLYAVHTIILYGSAWTPGFAMFYPKTLNIPLSIIAALLMIILMFGIVFLVERLKNYRRRKFVTVEI